MANSDEHVTSQNKLDTLYSFRITKQLRDTFIRVCDLNGDVPSQVIREMIEAYLDNNVDYVGGTDHE